MRLIIIFLFIVLAGFTKASDPVDFNPDLLSKVLKRQYKLLDFSMIEISTKENTQKSVDILGKYFKLQSNSGKVDTFYVYIGRVLSCRAGGCANPIQNNILFESEYFDYFIVFNSAKTVEAVRVYNYQASHGQEVSAPGWLKQFVGYGGQERLVVGREIDAISGATISADGITMDLQTRCREIRKFLD